MNLNFRSINKFVPNRKKYSIFIVFYTVNTNSMYCKNIFYKKEKKGAGRAV